MMNKTVITSDCPNGPIEIIDKSKNGYLYKNNSLEDFIKIFNEAYTEDNKILFEKKKNLKKKCKEFTIFQHHLKLLPDGDRSSSLSEVLSKSKIFKFGIFLKNIIDKIFAK